jgi:hypothetical protein
MRFIQASLLAASFLLCGSVQAASVAFSIDGIFTPVVNPIEESAVGFVPDLGRVVFERGDVGPDEEYFVALSDLTLFDLDIPITNTRTGEPAGSFAFSLPDLQSGSCTDAAVCGLDFTGNSFSGFRGSIGAGEGFLGNDLLRLSGTMLGIDTGFDPLASGTLRFNYLGKLDTANPVPEPSSWAMMGASALLAGFWMSRRRNTTRV